MELLEAHGRLFAFVNKMEFSDGTFRAVAEYCSTAAASQALHALRESISVMVGTQVFFAYLRLLTTLGCQGLRLTVRPWTSDVQVDSELASSLQGLLTPSAGFDAPPRRETYAKSTRGTPAHINPGLTMYPFVFSPQYPAVTPFMVDRFAGTSQLPLGPVSPMTPLSPGYPMIRSIYHSPPSPAMTSHHSSSPSRATPGYMRPDGRRQHAARVTRSTHGAGSHHNHVDTARIREGIDVRTTVRGFMFMPSRHQLIHHRSCSATSRTRSTRPCSRDWSMTRAGASTISCTSASTSRTTASMLTVRSLK